MRKEIIELRMWRSRLVERERKKGINQETATTKQNVIVKETATTTINTLVDELQKAIERLARHVL